MRKLIVAVVTAGALAVSGTAAAAGPVRSEAVFDLPDPEVYAECEGFDIVLSNMRIERSSLTWYDGDAAVLERRNVSFAGVLTNSLTGRSARFSGRFQRVEDFVAGTLTLTGLVRQVVAPGQPALLVSGLDATAANGDLLFQAGHSLGAWEEDLCAYMA